MASGKAAAASRQRYAADPERFRRYHNEWRTRSPERLARMREHDRKKNHRMHVERVTAQYAITVQQYEAMLEAGCALCGAKQEARSTKDGRPYRLALDHDHATGELRGVLCGTCNTRLGWFEKRRAEIERYLCR
jgi:hypothetical protein